jgi:MoaA/NifB/PqqE/SkfB family radical SAM enzyme
MSADTGIAPKTDARQGASFKLIFELTDLCNFSCVHCFRTEPGGANHRYLEMSVLDRVLDEVAAYNALDVVALTGGEPTLHPEFADIVGRIADRGHQLTFVTNGQRFDHTLDSIRPHWGAIRSVAFSLDGGRAETHDAIRRRPGSFRAVVAGVNRCRSEGIQVQLNSVITRANADELEEIVSLAARLDCRAVGFAHCQPTPEAVEAGLVMNIDERRRAEADVATLDDVYRIDVVLAGDHFTEAPFFQCPQLRMEEINIDFRGRLTACCMLSGFRAGAPDTDVLADLNRHSLYTGHQRLVAKIAEINAGKIERLSQGDLSPGERFMCTYCMQHYGKAPDLIRILESDERPTPKARLEQTRHDEA